MTDRTITRLQLLLIETSSSRPRDVTAITRTEMAINGGVCRIDEPQVERFGGNHPICTWPDLADAANSPNRVNILVTHDIARVSELLPDAITGNTPWIATGKLILQCAPKLPSWSPEAACACLGQTAVLDAAAGSSDQLTREGLALGLLTQHLYAELGLRRMVAFSKHKMRPVGPTPRLDDGRGWSDMPYDDLRWLATCAEGAALADLPAEQLLDRRIGDRALREFNRRRIWAARPH